jgi:hypothetical protein
LHCRHPLPGLVIRDTEKMSAICSSMTVTFEPTCPPQGGVSRYFC